MQVLVAGWFSFERMGATAGDLLSRDVVCRWLSQAEIPFDVAVATPFTGGVCLTSADPSAYSHVVFVFGPFGNGPPTTESLERDLKKDGIPVCRGGEYDRWDLRARTRTPGVAVALLAIEEHGSGKQLARWRLAPRPSVSWVVAMLVLGLLALGAGLDGAWVASGVLAVATALLGWRIATDCGSALGSLSDSVDRAGA